MKIYWVLNAIQKFVTLACGGYAFFNILNFIIKYPFLRTEYFNRGFSKVNRTLDSSENVVVYASR